MTKVEKIIMAVILVLIPFIFIFWNDIERKFKKEPSILPQKEQTSVLNHEAEKEKNDDITVLENNSATPNGKVITIKQKWELPEELTEISGLAYLSDHTFACIQDEDGAIFIYDLNKNEIVKQINFGKRGDYEGIAVVGATAYVLKSNGEITEVANFNSEKPQIKEYNTFLSKKNDAEGLCYDKKNNRLLIAIKGKTISDADDERGVFAFDLSSKKMMKDPVYAINLESKLFEKVKKKKVLAPSEIAIHPLTGEIYIVDGPDARLLILNESGSLKHFHQLNKDEFPQAEGLSFNDKGELFISNEGVKNKGTIIKVSFQ